MQSSTMRQAASSQRCSGQPFKPNQTAPRARICSMACQAAGAQDPLLLRVARGEDAERTPVWLMRQAGRYMAAFREFSDKYPFRMRSETPDIAIELSLQPLRAFRPDGIIFFSDILTPLPGMGIEFDMVKGKGPVIANPVRSAEHLRQLVPLSDPASRLPFIQKILSTLRQEADSEGVTLLGFIGTPWTLAAYAMEGKADKDCKETKVWKIMFHNPALLHSFLDFLTEQLIVYAGYQIESGAQVIQLFDSWAHHLSPAQFAEFSMPYAERITRALKAKYPHVPVIFHANGGTGKLELMKETAADVVGLDWAVDMKDARATLGHGVKVQGNVDPMSLFGPEEHIRVEVERCLRAAGPRGHILNVGHGVVQGTPESSVALFCELARQSGQIHAKTAPAATAATASSGVRAPVLA
ncbi:uroporphyrinogen decarboxylase chloroplast precursor [Volvox carteri f. nagariensis]|uniref:Uroporphyrinogen decarboxylase n=1 Tax=Volvox carteri f. nagariensis TaxID=3068 RepID=D8TPV9_VOLCA|nr:uroporphyrinogen decarboxylase chloroplast precursor [Volvox carteri f. nagariensis]EFJ50429.1 uroporphyrinogen decarboxylase chloroplast precursor [Volvox carteri f. nagariensis]|eukprot:XP_002948554.1 uroporphyrinogen decarboxylase chloroplast precursor [Volvox carteri f. nagariensis]